MAISIIKTGGGVNDLSTHTMGTGGQPEGATAVVVFAVPSTTPAPTVTGPEWGQVSATTVGASRVEVWSAPTGPSYGNVYFAFPETVAAYFSYSVFGSATLVSATVAPDGGSSTQFTSPSVTAAAGDLLWATFAGYFATWLGSVATVSAPSGMTLLKSSPQDEVPGWAGVTASESLTSSGDTTPRTATCSQPTGDWVAASLLLRDVNAAPADQAVTPAAVTFTDADGTASDTYTIPATTGVEYIVNGAVNVAGTYAGTGTVTVTAQATPGYVLAPGSVASWSHTFDATTAPPPVEHLRRYFDTAPVLAGIDSATTFAEAEAAFADLGAAYGFTLTADNTGTSVPTGWTAEPYQFTDPNFKGGLRIIADEMAKYPPAFIASAGIGAINLIKSLGREGATRDYGAVTLNSGMWIDMDGATTFAEPNAYAGNHRFKAIIHHELQHVMYYQWGGEFLALESQWVANNPEGFVYNVNTWKALDGEPRPTGFVRDYGRHSYIEDLADTWGRIMTTELYDQTLVWMDEDPGVAGKVQILKDWAATKSDVMASEGYYTTVHLRPAGPDKAVTPWDSAVLSAVGEGAWSQVSGPSVTFSLSGTDLIFTPPAAFVEQVLTFDYGGDQTVVTVAPATWGVKQAGVVVPVRLTRK